MHDGTTLERGLADLLRLPLTTSEPELFRMAIDLAEAVTGSEIGYLHYVNDVQTTIELGTWSTRTVQNCAVVSDRHYPVESAGVWADTFRQRKSQVHNDYAAMERRGGLPMGHVPLHRHLGVPVLEGGMVRLLLGVGNRADDYDDRDVRACHAIADDTWLITRRLREFARDRETLALIEGGRSANRVGVWEWDPEVDHVQWSAESAAILGLDATPAPADGWQPLMQVLPSSTRQHLQDSLDSARFPEPIDCSVGGRGPAGQIVAMRVSGVWISRSTGNGFAMRGVLSDTSLLAHLEQARFDSTHDPLTGVLNRAGLVAALQSRLSETVRRSRDEFAVLFIDLDGFKVVNDRLGHLGGDEVLRACAGRLSGVVPGSGVMARYGGDEFVVVQGEGPSVAEVEALGATLIETLSTPISTRHGTALVGACIGAVRSVDSGLDAASLLATADAAMYAAKSSGQGVVVVAGESDRGTVKA